MESLKTEKRTTSHRKFLERVKLVVPLYDRQFRSSTRLWCRFKWPFLRSEARIIWIAGSIMALQSFIETYGIWKVKITKKYVCKCFQIIRNIFFQDWKYFSSWASEKFSPMLEKFQHHVYAIYLNHNRHTQREISMIKNFNAKIYKT